jgi:hypothetical protein
VSLDDCVKDPNFGVLCRLSPWLNETDDECLLKLQCGKTTFTQLDYEKCVNEAFDERGWTLQEELFDKTKIHKFYRVDPMTMAEIKLLWSDLPAAMIHDLHYIVAFYFFDRQTFGTCTPSLCGSTIQKWTSTQSSRSI